MSQAKVNGLVLEYEDFGERSDPPLLLVMGLNAQMTGWPEDFCRRLADRGHYVVRFDNRDVGLSTWFDQHPPGDPVVAFLSFLEGGSVEAPYSLSDLADDTAGLIDFLGFDSTHVVGASFGGMIAQRIAMGHPERVRSLTSIMSMPRIVPLDLDVLLSLQPPDIDPSDPETIADIEVATARIYAGTGFEFDEVGARERSLANQRRAWHPEGGIRQAMAALADEDRRPGLASLDVPTLVIHGTEDPLIPPQGGQETADAVPGAELVWIDGLGHEMPEPAWQLVLDPICALVARVESGD
ncbi:MAG TPA: alpha/beta hydrolase [Acidimicrobiaceae bacterium]|nr:alpha/beta hydrolase [Acidimicrobiaceae bacterium]|tara:strand:- start:2209 stop:3099 length:891 start_codon:yes stop_codon:yes gene_type:complete